MAITQTRLHASRVVDQIRQNLTNLQIAMRRNAETHKAMAQAQSPSLSVLQTFVADCATRYLGNIQWIADLRADATRRTRMLNALTLMGWDESDIVDVATDLRNAALALQAAPINTYAEIIAACDAVIATVDAPESLWPE
jgi:hypothetical protein